MAVSQVNSGKHALNWAMYYGFFMGLFWILKFMLVPFVFRSSVASLAFVVLTIAVPFVGYFMARQYRDRCCPDGRVGLLQAWLFCSLLYVFAALITSVGHYLYFSFLDGGQLVAGYRQILDAVASASPEMKATFDVYEETLDLLASMSPVQLTIQLISNNVFYGLWLALPTALIVALTGKNVRG